MAPVITNDTEISIKLDIESVTLVEIGIKIGRASCRERV